jgi:putative SOS response-associated peptidase YedK
MPVILPRADEEEWLSRDVTDPHQVERLLVPYPAEAMTAWPVGLAVNNVRNDDPRLIEPIGETMSEADRGEEPDAEDDAQGRLFD